MVNVDIEERPGISATEYRLEVARLQHYRRDLSGQIKTLLPHRSKLGSLAACIPNRRIRRLCRRLEAVAAKLAAMGERP